MLTVTDVEYLGDHRLRLAFSDGFVGVVDLSAKLDGPVFQPVKDPTEFAKVRLTDHTIEWDCGADLAPEYLRDLAAAAAITETSSAP